MKRRFLVHNLNHTTLLVDITSIGLPNEIFPPQGKLEQVPSLRFQGLPAAEEYLTQLGAEKSALQQLQETLKKSAVGILTIT